MNSSLRTPPRTIFRNIRRGDPLWSPANPGKQTTIELRIAWYWCHKRDVQRNTPSNTNIFGKRFPSGDHKGRPTTSGAFHYRDAVPRTDTYPYSPSSLRSDPCTASQGLAIVETSSLRHLLPHGGDLFRWKDSVRKGKELRIFVCDVSMIHYAQPV